MKETKVAGVSLGGGRKENFFLCLLEYYPDKDRWFLKSLNQVKDEEENDRDQVLTNWINQYELKNLVVDFPLSSPPCETCKLECPGSQNCPQPPVVAIREEIEDLLRSDQSLYEQNPKKYEADRLDHEQVHFTKDLLGKKSDQHLLSRSFKRKLKKGYIPYWHRPIDFWIWKNYYDQLLEIFKNSYDSYGHVSLMMLARLNYLLRHFPKDLNIFESSSQLCLLEFYRSRLIGKFQLLQLYDLEMQAMARQALIKGIEEQLHLFIYHHDFDLIVRNPKAFDSFLLAIAGQRLLLNKLRELPKWAHDSKFIVPDFQLQ